MVFSAKIIIDLDYMHFSKDPSIKCLLYSVYFVFIYLFLKKMLVQLHCPLLYIHQPQHLNCWPKFVNDI